MERRLKFPLGQEVAAGFVVPDLDQLPPPTHEEVARRAYAIYEARGGGNGRALDDWLQAEKGALRREGGPGRGASCHRADPPALDGRRVPKAGIAFAATRPDIVIAVTAAAMDAVLLTRNARDFSGIPGLRLEGVPG
jgi:hypothetical protein